MPRNQTISYLKSRFEQAGVTIQKRHGQNFLIDMNLLYLLAESADVSGKDVVLEVGTGTGALTAFLAERAACVVTVEIDPAMFQIASEELIDFENVRMFQQDALRNKNSLHPDILNTVTDALGAGPDRQFKLVANLPYNVATPIISNLLTLNVPPTSMTVTIQKELADRIVAPPKTKDYSALSVWIQSQCKCEILRTMPPEVFWPRPKVHSAILQITVDPALRSRIADRDFFHDFVRALFFHRRKLLRGVLVAAFKKSLDKPAVDEVLAELSIPGDARAEELDVEKILELSEAIRRRVRF